MQESCTNMEVKMIAYQRYVYLAFLLPLPLSAQWLETTIAVGTNPYALVYNTTNNKT